MAKIVFTLAQLAAETTVPVYLLADNIDLMKLIRDGAEHETLLEFVNENW
jgi:hypothetical protein